MNEREPQHEPMVRGQSLSSLIATATFADVFCLLLRGSAPNEQERALLDAMLVAACDHGAEPPSSIAARASASSGNPLHVAVAAGLLGMGPKHGCAVEDAMDVLGQAEDPAAIVRAYRAMGKRLPGYGHRIYAEADPRTTALLARAHALGRSGVYVARARALEDALATALGRRLVLNIDGCLAALLLELGFPKATGNAIFMTSRIPGLAARAIEAAATMVYPQGGTPARVSSGA